MEQLFHVVVPLDYAADKSRQHLSPASIESLVSASEFLAKRDSSTYLLVCGNTNHPQEGMFVSVAIENRKRIISCRINDSYKRFFTEATNSIDEAENIKKKLKSENISVASIHIFCDRYHVARARLIWKHIFPFTELHFHSVVCPWGKDQAQFIQRNRFVWAAANYVAWFIMKIRGMESMRNVKQKS